MPADDDRKREEEQSSRIKVTDRRAFTREGSRREPDAPPEASEGHVMGAAAGPLPAPESPDAASAGREARGARPAAAPAADRPATRHDAGAAPDAGPGDPPEAVPSIDFVAFVQSLYVGALMALGEVENPYTRQFETNLDLARQNIDILVMLLEKTRGNLTSEEDGFIGQVVPQLQLLFAKKAG